MRIKVVYGFPNGNLLVFDENAEQVPSLQGPVTTDRMRAIVAAADDETEWKL